MTQDKFFDRQYYLDILNRRINSFKDKYRQNIAFLGDELVGKTSIILHFLHRFIDNRVLLLYLDVRSEKFEYFARRFIGVLLYNFLINSGIALKEDLGFLINKSESFIPKTVAKAKSILADLERRKKDALFLELFSLCEGIYQETQKSCVIILDEFHNLEFMRIENLYREWAKILVSQKNTMFLITSSAKSRARKILSEKLSLLFGSFEIIKVEPLDLKTSDEFLQNRIGRLSLDKLLRNFLTSFAGGSPFYLEVLSAALCKIKSQDVTDNPITDHTIIESLQDLLYEETGVLNQRYYNYLRNILEKCINQDYIRILYCICNGHNRIKDMMRTLHKQKKEIVKLLNQLIELDVVDRNGDFFKISDRIFSFWLKFVHQKKTSTLSFDAEAKRQGFRKGISRMIEEFTFNSRKAIVERVEELLHLFENEGVYIGRKKLRLTNFREIKPLKFNYPNLREGLIGRTPDCLWIIAIKDDMLTDEDITDFSKECKRYRQRSQRRIFITPLDVDTNVRLRALEERIWTWNLDNLNLLCDLFNKPEIIL